MLKVDSTLDIRVRGLRCIVHQEHDLMTDCCVEALMHKPSLPHPSACHAATPQGPDRKAISMGVNLQIVHLRRTDDTRDVVVLCALSRRISCATNTPFSTRNLANFNVLGSGLTPSRLSMTRSACCKTTPACSFSLLRPLLSRLLDCSSCLPRLNTLSQCWWVLRASAT